MSDDLTGVPGLGPVRRAALLAAGVSSRADLARASVEQLVGMTGMGRTQAEKITTWLHANGHDDAPPAIAGDDEAMPRAVMTASAAGDTHGSPFDRTVFAARTALSDATRTFAAAGRLQKPFVRLAKRLDTIEEKIAGNTLGAGRCKRIEKRLLALTMRLEKAAQKAVVLSPKREDKLRERVQNESRVLAGLLTEPVKRSASKSTPPVSSRKAKK